MNVSRCRSVRRDHKAVRRRRRAVLVRERQVIARRLAAAVRVNEDGPILGRRRPVLEMAERSRATPHGGMATVSKVVAHSGLAAEIDRRLDLLASHRPYYESDHVLNLASLDSGSTTRVSWSGRVVERAEPSDRSRPFRVQESMPKQT